MDKRKRRLLCMLEGSGRKSRWISGAPPLSFKAFAAGELENYRIYGNTVGGESVGDLVTSGEHEGEYKVPVTVSNGTDTLTTLIYLPEQIKRVGDEAEYVDYAEQKQHRVRKNLLPTLTTTYSANGIEITPNSDGGLIVNGTATATSYAYLRGSIVFPFDTIVSGCPENGSMNTFCLRAQNMATTANVATDYGDGALIPANTEIYLEIRIQNGTVCDNLTFYPMIRKADIEDDTYEPYIENVDLDVTLPALPTIAGSNVLTVGTEVQPSEIEVKGKIKAL